VIPPAEHEPVEESVPAERRAAPRWVVAMDVAAILCAALALYVALAGRGLLLRYGQFVLPSASFLIFLSVAIVLVRHVARAQPSIADTLAGWRASLDRRPHAASAVRAFVATRLMVFLVAYFAVVTIGFPPRPVGFTLSPDPLANLPARYDAGWYGGIARSGYEWDRQFDRQRNIAFFPALPMLMRPVGSFLGANTPTLPRERRLLRMLWAGVIVSLAAFAWALYYLARLGDLLAGPRAAAWAPLLLASYPFAVFFSVPYTEALFLLGCVGAFYHFHRAEWVRAALWGLLVGLTRPNGAFLSVALAVLALQQVWPLDRAGVAALARRLFVASMPGAGMLLFTAYLYNLTGIWFAWARMHGAWGRTWSTRPIEQGWEWLTTEGLTNVLIGVPYDVLNTLPVLFVLALVWPIARRLGAAYAVFVLLNVVPPVFAGGALSMGRVTATIFPAFIVLAVLLPARAVPAWISAFALMQGLIAVLFFTWREIF
jgi:hypothetical protein